MNIVQIIPGSGGSFYCGNCLRDSKIVQALRKSGHDVVIVPMYLPLFSIEDELSEIPVFYGAVSIYLKQLYPFLRKAPAWFDRLLNSRPVLKLAASKAGTTRAKGLEEMTVSMLLGEQGEQSEELDKMVDWIAEHCKPDVVHLSNALLLGLAKRIRTRLNVPVVCTLQDEHTWVDVMQPSFRDSVWQLMSEKARDVDIFISVSDFYAGLCKRQMNLDGKLLETLHLGVDINDYEYRAAHEKERTIGFLSRMCHDNGLDILVDAFISIRARKEFQDVRLLITGGNTDDDNAYLKRIRKKLKRYNLEESVEFQDDFYEMGKKKFFNRVSLLSVPVRFDEAFGIYLIEAMASGIPVVQPARGAFPEIINNSKSGMLYSGDTVEILAETLMRILDDKSLMRDMSKAARSNVEMNFDIYRQAAKLVDIYSKTTVET